MKALIDRLLTDPMAQVPEHLREGLRRYMVAGVRPGHFLMAVLENDLVAAVRRGDPESQAGLIDLVKYLEHHAPAGCYGDVAAVDAWMRDGGAKGLT